MDMFATILDCCTPSERELLAPILRGARNHLATQPAHNPYAKILEDAQRDTERRLAESGWWNHGRIGFREAPSYAMRSQDLHISDELRAKDRHVEKQEALRRRQAQYNALQRKNNRAWRNTLTRRLKSG